MPQTAIVLKHVALVGYQGDIYIYIKYQKRKCNYCANRETSEKCMLQLNTKHIWQNTLSCK